MEEWGKEFKIRQDLDKKFLNFNFLKRVGGVGDCGEEKCKK